MIYFHIRHVTRDVLLWSTFLHVWLEANTCDLSPTAEMPAALLRPFSLCSVLFTLPRAKDSSQAAPSRLVLLRQSLKTAQSWLVLVWCPGYCDRHVSLFPHWWKCMKRFELGHHLRFVWGMAGVGGGQLWPLAYFYHRKTWKWFILNLCAKDEFTSQVNEHWKS